MSARTVWARLGSLAVLIIGIGVWPLVAGLEIPHVHLGGDRPLAHRHLHAGHHRHHVPHHNDPVAPQRRQDDERQEPSDNVLSFQAGASLLPVLSATRNVARSESALLRPDRGRPRAVDLMPGLGPRPPPH